MASFQWAEEEYVAAAIGSHHRRYIKFAILGPVMFALIACSLFLQKYGWPSVLIGGIAGIVFTTLFFFQIRKFLRKAFRQHSIMRETFHLALTEEGIDHVHDSGKFFYKWDQTRYWREDPRFLYLFESDVTVRMIPKRALSQEEERLLRSQMAKVPKK
jgi:hypothetical protein